MLATDKSQLQDAERQERKMFTVIKSGSDGIGIASCLSVAEVCNEIWNSRGWKSKKAMDAAIRKWASTAEAGDVYPTAFSAIVAGRVERDYSDDDEEACPNCGIADIEYSDLDPIESGSIQQQGKCNSCLNQWVDEFKHVARHELAKAKK